MRNLSRISLAVAASAALVGAIALPATAAPTAADTAVTVVISGGDLTMSAPTTAGLGTVAPGILASVPLAAVNVTDTRAGVLGWQAQVTMGNLVGGTNPAHVILASAATYTPGVAVVIGDALVGNSEATGLAAATTVQEATNVVGNNDATWDATLSIQVPTNALADSYSATLTHSVL